MDVAAAVATGVTVEASTTTRRRVQAGLPWSHGIHLEPTSPSYVRALRRDVRSHISDSERALRRRVISGDVGGRACNQEGRLMSRSVMEVVEGKAVYNGRPLADWVPDVIQRVFERTDALRVVVFGSVQRGDDGPDSDIDLLVVLPRVMRRHDDAVRVLRQLRDLPVPVEVIVVDDALLERESHVRPVVRAALREGRTVERAA